MNIAEQMLTLKNDIDDVFKAGKKAGGGGCDIDHTALYNEGYGKGYTEGETVGYNKGYADGQENTPNPLEYATQLDYMFKNATFPTDYELTLNIPPSLTTMASVFYPSSGVKKVTIKGGNETNVVSFNSTFRNSENLETVDMTEFKGKIGNANALFWFNVAIQHILGELDFSECTSFSNAFNTANLVTITPKANTIKISVSFGSCLKLSAQSVQAIIDGLATVTTAQTITFHASIVLTDEQKAQILSKGWTLVQ